MEDVPFTGHQPTQSHTNKQAPAPKDDMDGHRDTIRKSSIVQQRNEVEEADLQ